MAARGEAAGVRMERLAQRMSTAISGRIDNPKPEPKVKIIVAKTAATTILLAKLSVTHTAELYRWELRQAFYIPSA